MYSCYGEIKMKGVLGMSSTGKEQIIENILIENYRMYYHLALGYVHNEADALDIVQEGAYKAILKSDTLRSEDHASTWIYRIMLNEIFSFCRSRKEFLPDNIQQMEEYFGYYDNSEGCADEMDLYNALEGLSDEEKKIVQLRYFQGLKLEEVAEAMNLNLSTVKSRLYRTIGKLRLSMSL